MVSNFDTNICKTPKKSQREFCFTHLCKVTAPLGYPSSYPVEGSETSSLTASGLLLCHIFHPSFWLSDQVSIGIFFFTFIISEVGLTRKPVLCKLPLRIWTIRLRATIWRHWQVWWNPLLLLSDLRLTPFWSTCKTWLWKFLLRKHGWSTTSVDMIILMTHRLDASLFTFPMVITAFFSAMMGGLLAPLVVNVAAR